MEKSRPKGRARKVKKKTEDPDELPNSFEDTSLFAELQQAMQDVSEDTNTTSEPRASSSNIEETREDINGSKPEASSSNIEQNTSNMIKPELQCSSSEDTSKPSTLEMKDVHTRDEVSNVLESKTEEIIEQSSNDAPKPEASFPSEERSINNTEMSNQSTEILLENAQESERESLVLNPYKDLQNTLDCLEEPESIHLEINNSKPEIVATAPEISYGNTESVIPRQQNYIPKYKYLNEEILKTIQPFTETQLSSLYHNHEIDFSKEYIKEFIESQKSLQNHKLYEMLSTYLRSRNKLIAAKLEIDNLNTEYKSNQAEAWTIGEATVTESGKCHDGNNVSVTHKYPVSSLNQQTVNFVSRSLSAIRDLVNEVYTLHAYSSEVLRLQIEHYIQEILSYYSKVPHNTPVQLYTSNNMEKEELCVCISILFMFQRRQIKDEQFISDSKDWLLKLGSILLRIATAKDHLFLLHHILRSPGGITKWAVTLIQIPIENLLENYPSTSSALLDHCIAILYVLMQPIHGREQFVEDKFKSLEDQWIFLDSDGDEDETPMALLENDLVAILNQIPIDSIFRHVLGIQHRDNREFYYGENVSEKNLLQLFAFATTLVKLLKTGLQTYNTPRYRQFAKRLGRLIRHTVQYVSEQWELFRNNSLSTFDPGMLARLQVEYDSLLLRATESILSSQRLGAWQFLAVVPYNVVSSNMLWRLFCLLHQEENSNSLKTTDWRTQLPELKEEFEAKLSSLPEAEVYFLLSAFASMALARGPEDMDFVHAVTLDLFQVGFASKTTQESCSKTARSLLANLTTKYPHLISVLLTELKQNIDNSGMLSVYLVKELPVHLWSPDVNDMSTLSEWLLSAPNLLQSSLARTYLATLDWSRMPAALQLQAAVLAVDACLRHATERAGHLSPGAVAEGVSSLAAMVRNQTSPEQGLNTWSWGLLSRLRLHLNDQHTWYHTPETLSRIPDLESDQSLEVLARGVRDKEPIACFAALLSTTWGHSVPLVCSKGVPLLNTLLSHGKYDALCEILHHVIPLFLDCAESLATNEKFIAFLGALITADRGYVKMAKNLLLPDAPGPVLKQVANMIESQFANSQRCGMESPDHLTDLWLLLLTSLPDWTREPCVGHLLDIVLRASYLHPIAREAAMTKLKSLYRNGITKQAGALSSILSWLGSGSSSLLPRVACPEAPWLALYVLEVEQNENETNNGLWRQLLTELASPSRPTLDQAMKKASNSLKVPAVAVANLALYRWSQQALDTILDHPLLPIFWQRFFTLYLARVPGGSDKECVGHRFFEGLVNVSYVKRLRRRLHDAAELYEARAAEPSVGEATEDEMSQHRALHARTSKMLRTFGLWLEEPRLQEPHLYLNALPPQYDPNKLALIFAGDNTPWWEFVDLQEIHEKQIDAVRDWQLQHFRHVDGSFRMPSKCDELACPLERMMKRLHSYDKPVPAPALKPLKCVVPFLVKEELMNANVTLNNLKQHFITLQEFTQVHALRSSELAALDCGLLEFIPTLYRECEVKVTLTAACEASARKKSAASECGGPFRVAIKFLESRINEGVQHEITQNRNSHASVLSRSLQTPPQGVCSAAVYTENLVSKLVAAGDQNVSDNRYKESGVTLFYHLVSMYNEQSAFYPPTKQLLTSCIEILGQVFISRDETQCERLLKSILSQTQLSGLLSPHFCPQLAATPSFLAMYRLVMSGCQSNPDTGFAILSKFDVSQWLMRARPRLRERSHFIETLGEALAASGRDPPQERLILHETFLRHLRHITLHDFPEHYGEVLQLILKGSEAQTLALDAWWCLLDCLTDQQRIRARDQLRVYATQQRLLGPQEVRETAALLASYFTKERLQYGLHGLYPKYRHYIEPLSLFMGMIGHSHVIGTLQQGRGALGDTLCDQMWPILSDLFSPWLTPYTGQQSAAWIQQLTDDRTVLLPWTALDATLAKSMMDSFVDIVQFLLDTLPACSSILCFVWQFYITHFTMAVVKEHVLEVVHTSLSVLPWDRFWPRPQDLDAMIKVVEQYLPQCHSFMGSVFVQVNWVAWVSQVHPEYMARTHVCLMHLLVKLGMEVKQDPKVIPLVSDCHRQLAWHLVDAPSFDLVLNWFVMSCDSRVILPGCTEVNPVDVVVLDLLQHIAGFTPECKQFHASTVRKRLAYVRSASKLMVSTSSRFKPMLTKNQDMFVNAVHKIANQIEVIIQHAGSQQISESALLLGELLSATSVSAPLSVILVPAVCNWVSQHTGRSVVVLGLLRTLGVSVTDQRALGALMEETITAFFRDTSAPNISWAYAVSILQPAIPTPKSQQSWEPLEHILVKEGHLLTLHALLLKRNPCEKSEQFAMLSSLIDWMSEVKISDSVERKLPMLWKLTFSLSLSLCQKSVGKDEILDQTLVLKLNQLAQYLTSVGEDKGWHLLGVIGLRKQYQASIKLRLLARTLAAFLLVQLPTSGDGDNRQVRLTADSPGALGDISSSCLSETLEPPAPSSQALQAVGALEALTSTKLNPPELKATLDQALSAVRDPSNCLATFDVIFFPLLAQLYQEPFLTL